MPTYAIAEAEADFDALIDRVEAGETIHLVTPEGRMARLVPLTPEEIARLTGERPV